MNYQDAITADIRLRLLQALMNAPEYTLPEATLSLVLEHKCGHAISQDLLALELAWLEEMGLLTRLPVGRSAIYVLSARGMDVARGRSKVPGVARPLPGEQP